MLERVAREFDTTVEVINIEQDQDAFDKYRYDIPVIYLDDVKLFKHRVDENKLRKVLNKVAQTSRLR